MATREQQFGAFIARCREALGWSQRRAAREIGVSSMRLAELERGISRSTGHATRASPDLVARMAATYEVPTETLRELAGYAREHPELSTDESLLLERYRKLEEPFRRIALELVASIDRVTAAGLPSSMGSYAAERGPAAGAISSGKDDEATAGESTSS